MSTHVIVAIQVTPRLSTQGPALIQGIVKQVRTMPGYEKAEIAVVLPEDFVKRPPIRDITTDLYMKKFRKVASEEDVLIIPGTFWHESQPGKIQKCTKIITPREEETNPSPLYAKRKPLSHKTTPGTILGHAEDEPWGRITTLICADAEDYSILTDHFGTGSPEDIKSTLVAVPARIAFAGIYRGDGGNLECAMMSEAPGDTSAALQLNADGVAKRKIALDTISDTFQQRAEKYNTIFCRVDHASKMEAQESFIGGGLSFIATPTQSVQFPTAEESVMVARVDVGKKDVTQHVVFPIIGGTRIDVTSSPL